MGNYESLKIKNQLCFPLYAASKEIVKLYYPYLTALNLTYTQYITMMVLWEEKRISVKELGAKLYLDSGTLSPVLKSLEKKGYISRHRLPEDERIVIVEITIEGNNLRESASEIPEKLMRCTALSHNDTVVLYTLLYKLLDNIRDAGNGEEK
ncbi:MAG: MarR family transcriptional regulator [Clostridia bacterium]|nr:MarR family transcriptional regulator [Clostridia bacterium]